MNRRARSGGPDSLAPPIDSSSEPTIPGSIRSSTRVALRRIQAFFYALISILFCAVLARAEERSPGTAAPEKFLKKLSLEELMNVEVTSVSKKPEKLLEVPAAVYVISGEDIRRSGATSIPEALRMAPGMQVARIDSNQWAIGSRGFASRLSRSMLAMMDGRSIYTPLFAGVYWEVQDTLLEDIDRIEVIRGPGGTLWGANAVNGIVNIITKSAKDTQGTYLTGGGGNEERDFGGFRYGGQWGASTYYRIYGKYFDRDGGFSHGTQNFDAWNMGRVGFRTDSDLSEDSALTVQGDLYDGHAGQRVINSTYSPPFLDLVQKDADLSGGNLLGRWRTKTGENSELALQAYYDQTFRREPTGHEQRNTYDVDMQHRFPLIGRQEINWGLGYRLSTNETQSIPTIQLVPRGRDLHLFSGFLQDEIVLVENRLHVTIGSKFENNDYTGFEFQPSGRILWSLTSSQVLWASFTRAVRTPSQLERGLSWTALIEPQTPTFARLIGDSAFRSEKGLAYELGYRIEPMERLFLDLAAFYTRYTDLDSLEPGTPFRESSPPPEHVVVPIFVRNRLDGDLYGAELSAESTVSDWWRVAASYAYLQISLQRDGSLDPTTIQTSEGSSPHHQASLRSMMDLPQGLEFDAWLRYVDDLPALGVGSYVTADARLGWRATRTLEISVTGQNLIESHHREFGGGSFGLAQDKLLEVERGVYGRVTWRW